MTNKQDLLAKIKQGLKEGVITENDVRSALSLPPSPGQLSDSDDIQNGKSDNLSAVDVMFYIAGIIFFAAIMSFIIQSWHETSAYLHILLSAGAGAVLWAGAYYMIKTSPQNEIRTGLINALLLTGSLSIIAGGYIFTNELIGGFDNVNFIPGAVMFAVLGALHLTYDKLVRKNLILLMGVLLAVVSFPALLFGILEDANLPSDIWAMIMIISTVLLAYATRVTAKIYETRQGLSDAFDSLAAFLALTTMYFSSFGQYGSLWLLIIITAIFGIFYLSILAQNKHLLGSASFFLVLVVISSAFQYFSGYGASIALFAATIGLLASAAIASSINRKYFN